MVCGRVTIEYRLRVMVTVVAVVAISSVAPVAVTARAGVTAVGTRTTARLSVEWPLLTLVWSMIGND